MLLRRHVLPPLLATLLTLSLAAGLSAMSVLAPTFQQLVDSAATIARGTVTDVHCIAVPTSHGEAVKTVVTLHVERALKGSPGETLTLTLLGGRIGGHTLRVDGMPQFHVGDREIVFVSAVGNAMCPVVAAEYGRYHIRRDPVSNRDYVARGNNGPLASTDAVAQSLEAAPAVNPAGALSPEAFESAILAAAHGSAGTLQR